MRQRCSFFVLPILVLLSPSTMLAATLYAKTDGSPSADCLSWSTACTLGRAMTVATASGDQIWVKAGNYGSIATANWANGVKIIGGFAGTESNASQCDPTTNVTILDGGGSTQCLFTSGHPASNMLRGFTVRNGYTESETGGGAVEVVDSSMMFVQCIFENNRADYFGAAAAIRGASAPQFINCTFKGNGTGSGTAVKPYGGGAVYLYGGSATFTNCLFHDNTAGDGGAVLNVFGTATFNNCTLANNSARIGYGGAVVDPEGRITFRNSILWGNTAVKADAQISTGSSTLTIATYSNVQGGWSGTGNINSDPDFHGSSDFSLHSASPCKNAGDNNLLPTDNGDLNWNNNVGEALPKDLGMSPRKKFVVVDMGAFEVQVEEQ